MSDTPKLLPCPFCASESVHYVLAWGVKCTHCGAGAPCRFDDIESVWNTRTSPTEARREGWEACRKSILAVCEDVEREAHEDWPDPNQFARGMKRAAKSIARGFGAMTPDDDDNLSALER